MYNFFKLFVSHWWFGGTISQILCYFEIQFYNLPLKIMQMLAVLDNTTGSCNKKLNLQSNFLNLWIT